ncbi:DUF7373 family lipoprotein [Nocardia sp. IFM 10818]
MHGVRAAVLLLTVALAAVTSCTIEGNPVPAHPDPTTLDVGGYSVQPLAAPDGNEQYGRVVESVRMADALIDPAEVIPELIFPIAGRAVNPLPTPIKARMLLAEATRPVLEREGLVAGCAITQTEAANDFEVGKARVLTVIVLRFPNAEAAARAARDIDGTDAAVSPENVPVQIPGHADAHAHWRPAVPTLAATIALDTYVVSVLAGHTSTDPGVLTAMASSAFTRQLARLRDFAPTPLDQLATLPLDREGMISRLVPESPGRWSYPAVVANTLDENAGWNAAMSASGVVFGPRGASLWSGRSLTNRQVEYVAVHIRDSLTRYSNPAAARAAWLEAKRNSELNESERSAESPPGVPDAFCVETAGVETLRYMCRVLYGRYMATLLMRDLKAAQQRVAAQYGLLVNGG